MKKLSLGIVGILLSSGIFFWNAQPDGLLHIYFLDVGQGDAILIRGPSGENILVDGGPDRNVLSELKDTLPFFDNTIDYIFLTHPDRDHIEGLIPVLKRYPVKQVMLTGAAKKSYLYDAFIRVIQEKNIPLIIADKNSDIAFSSGLFIDILFPFSQIVGVNIDPNNASLIAKVVYGENEVLLTGDSEAPEEEKLLSGGANLSADVLKVGHHGSNTSTTDKFLRSVSPVYSVISVGRGNSYHHPHPSIIKRLKEFGAEIHRTDLEGRIEFVFSKEKIVKINNQSNRSMSAPSLRSFSSKRS